MIGRVALAGLAALLVAGCGSPEAPSAHTATSTVVSSASTKAPQSASTATAAPETVSKNNPCAGAPFTPQQLSGTWTEQGGSGRTGLAADGTLTIDGGSATETGTWSYTPWEFTSAADQMPPSAAGQCVLWLRITAPAPASNLVYVPLELNGDSLRLSYVGRGNTLTWTRSAGTP